MKTIDYDLYHAEIPTDKQRKTPQTAMQVYLPVLGHEYTVLFIYMPMQRQTAVVKATNPCQKCEPQLTKVKTLFEQ